MRSSLANRIAALEAEIALEDMRIPVLHIHFDGSAPREAKTTWKPGDAPDLHIRFTDKWKPGDPPPPSAVWLGGGEQPQPTRKKSKSRRTRK